MTGREITSLSIKLFAIYVLVNAVLAIPTFVMTLVGFAGQSYLTPESVWFWALGVIAVLSLLVLFVVLWRLANRFVEPHEDTSDNTSPLAIDEPFVLSALGLYLSFDGLMRIATLSVRTYVSVGQNHVSLSTAANAETIAYIVCYCFQVIFGLTLVLRSRGWAALLHRLRNAGLAAKRPVGG